MKHSHPQWFYRALRASLLVGMSSAVAGCLSHSVDRVPNVERAAIVWRQRDANGVICLEYSTAAHELKSQRAGIDFAPVAGKSVSLSFESSASLAQIYTVSDIMQFGHATLYRLCEAANNKNIDKEQYRELVGKTLENLTALMKLQTTASNQRVIGRLFEKKETIDRLKRKIDDLDRSTTPQEPGRRAFLEASLREEQTEFDEMTRANRIDGLFDEAKEPVGEGTKNPQGPPAPAPSKTLPVGKIPPVAPAPPPKTPR